MFVRFRGVEVSALGRGIGGVHKHLYQVACLRDRRVRRYMYQAAGVAWYRDVCTRPPVCGDCGGTQWTNVLTTPVDIYILMRKCGMLSLHWLQHVYIIVYISNIYFIYWISNVNADFQIFINRDFRNYYLLFYFEVTGVTHIALVNNKTSQTQTDSDNIERQSTQLENQGQWKDGGEQTSLKFVFCSC